MRRLVTVVVAAALVAAAGWTGWQWSQARSADAVRAEVREVASALAVAVLSYDHRDLDASPGALAAVATEEFARQYRERFAQELRPTIEQLEVVASADVEHVYLPEITGEEVTAVVAVTARIRSVEGERTADSYLLVTLRRDDTWQVTDVAGIASAATIPGADE